MGADVLPGVVNNIAYASQIQTKDEICFIALLETLPLYLFKMLQAVTSPGSCFILVQYESDVTNWPYTKMFLTQLTEYS